MAIKNNLTKIALAGALVLGLTVNGVSKEIVKHGVDPQSPFAQESVSCGLDPQSTSGYGLYATKLGLPLTATPDEIIERKFGFNPNTIPNAGLQQRVKDLGYKEVQGLYDTLLEGGGELCVRDLYFNPPEQFLF